MLRLKYLIIFIFLINTCFSQSQKDSSLNNVSKNYALVVGISTYQYIRPLKYADDDAYIIAKFLLDQKICTNNNLYLLIDSNATTANFYRDLKKILLKASNNDKVFIYFAGHGDVETDLESGFLLTYNTEKNNYPASSIDITMLEKHINALVNKNINVVLITDACRSGNLIGGMTGAANTISSITKGFNNVVKILSCQPNQLSQEKMFTDGGHGVFTYHLVNGLNGLADKNNNNQITLREIDTYLDEVSSETNYKQIPKVDGDPKSIINSCNEEIKIALISKKSFGNYTTRNNEFSNDTLWNGNKYYQLFMSELQKGNYVELNNNALSIINLSTSQNQPIEMLNEMKLNLIAALEDKAQSVINNVLIGNFSTKASKETQQVRRASRYLEIIIDIVGNDDIRINELIAKLNYFKCLDATITHNYSKMKYYVNKLIASDTILTNKAWIKNLIGLTYYYLYELNLSKAYLLSAVRLSPSWSSAWNNLGLTYNALNILDSSKAAYLKAIELEGEFDTGGTALSNIGQVYLKLKDTITAEKYFIQSIKVNPNNPYPYSYLSWLNFDQKKLSKSLEYILNAIKADSIQQHNWIYLAKIYHNMGKIKEMDYAIMKSISCDTSSIGNWESAISFYEEYGYKGKLKALFKEFDNFLNINYGKYSSSYDYKTLADIYLKQDKIDSTIKYLNLSLTRDPENIESLNMLAYIFYYSNKLNAADSLASLSLSINSNYVDPFIIKGLISYDQDSLSLSENYFSSAFKIDSINSEVNQYLGRIYLWNGDFKISEYHFLKSVEYDSTNAIYWNWLGYFYLRSNLILDNLAVIREYEFNKSLSIDPELNQALWYIGCIKFIANEKLKALKYFERALNKGYSDIYILNLHQIYDGLKDNNDFRLLLKKYKIKD